MSFQTLRQLEKELDSQQERGSHTGSGISRGAPSGHYHGGAAGSGSKNKHTPSISVPSMPDRTVVGFGPNSLTKTGFGESPSSSQRTPPSSLPTGIGLRIGGSPVRPHQQHQQHQQGGDGKYPKKAKLSKAEMREKQERQRAEKARRKAEQQAKGGSGSGSKKKKKGKQVAAMDDEKQQKQKSKSLAKQKVPERTSVRKQVGLFSHLHQYERGVSLTKDIPMSAACPLHPAVIRLGLKLSEGVLSGSTERCVGLLETLKVVFQDYTTPPGKDLSRDLSQCIQPYISFLGQCRPLSASMGNAIKYVKHEITHELSPEMTEEAAKARLCACIDSYVKERIILAQVVISQSATTKIADGDVILVHSRSCLLFRVLYDAHKAGKKFRVLVVDSRPSMKGRPLFEQLIQVGVPCNYVLINAISYVMREVSKVLLSAEALLANGYVMGPVGSSLVAMMARSYNVPVIVCCETYKFCERVQTDSFVFNELGDPDDLVDTSGNSTRRHGPSGRNGRAAGEEPILGDWEQIDNLKLLNLVYDVTPPAFIDMVVTELGMIPCTSVPVVLRVKEAYKG